jgi:hypothetical protein
MANRCITPEGTMSSIVKVIEVIAQSDKGFDDAVRNVVKETGKSVTGIKSIWIDNFEVTVENNEVKQFRVNAKVSFLVEGHK